jgi:hypothetical protein
MFFMTPGNSSFFVQAPLRQRNGFPHAQPTATVFSHAQVILFPLPPEAAESLLPRRIPDICSNSRGISNRPFSQKREVSALDDCRCGQNSTVNQ